MSDDANQGHTFAVSKGSVAVSAIAAAALLLIRLRTNPGLSLPS